MTDGRPNPDDLLTRLADGESADRRGKLKIFFGSAPGVGKTYAMLEAGRKAGKEGRDVVVGYVEPHVRPDTQALILGLDVLPRRTVEYRGHTLHEFDLEAALARRPQLLLVDELAHTNALGSTHAKRWQDVHQLLDAGIDVYTTLNVQHIESLNDVVTQVTMAPVRETVPDRIFEQADEVELVDIAPDDLIERMKEGKVYVPDQARRAIENFFRPGNLIALRELSLRKTAERVGEQALDYRHEHSVSKIWPVTERLLVCVGAGPSSARLVRSTRRMAAGLRAPWTALHVEVDNRPLRPEHREQLDQNLRLAEQLGAKVDVTSGLDFADAVLRYGREHNVTKIVVGKPRLSLLREWLRGTYVYDLIRRSGDIDVYVISGDESSVPSPASRIEQPPTSRLPYLWSIAATAACTLAAYLLFPYLSAPNLVMIYLAGVVGVALTCGRGPSMLAALLSVAIFDFWFVPPYGTFAVHDTQYLFTFAVLLLTGLTVSELVARVRAQTEATRRRERKTAALLELSREMSSLPTHEAVAAAARRIIRSALDVDVWIAVPSADGSLVSGDPSADACPPAKDEGVISWVYDHGQAAGRGTDTLPGGEGTYLPLKVTGGTVGVLGVRPLVAEQSLNTTQLQLLEAFAGQTAGAVERCNLAVEAEKVRLQMETERLRNSLLSAVSHDLRTPLATITGAASALVEGNEQLFPEARRELADSIVDESARLNQLVANLLDLTRLEAGAMKLNRQWQPIDESIGVALQRLERQLADHPIVTHLPDDLPPVPIDGILIQQVLINLLDNAVKFSPAGGEIEIAAAGQDHELVVRIADRGPGIPADQQRRVFDKFYRVEGHGRAGTGIGLAICRGIIELHGGRIAAENRPDGGAVFSFTLPLNSPIATKPS